MKKRRFCAPPAGLAHPAKIGGAHVQKRFRGIIRPRAVWEIVKEEMKALRDESGMLKKELHRPAQCCVCRKDDSDFLLSKEGLTFVKCRDCGLIYVNPQCDETGAMAVEDAIRESIRTDARARDMCEKYSNLMEGFTIDSAD